MKKLFVHSFVLASLASVGCAGAADGSFEPPTNVEAVAQDTQADSTCVNVLSSIRNQIPHVGPAYGILTTYQPGLGVVSLTFTGYGGPSRF